MPERDAARQLAVFGYPRGGVTFAWARGGGALWLIAVILVGFDL